MLCGWKVLRHLTCVILTCFHNFDVCVLVPLLCYHKTCYLFFFLHFLDLNLVIGYEWCASLCTIIIYQVKHLEITPSECNISPTLKMELIDHLIIDLPWNHVDYSYKPWCKYLGLFPVLFFFLRWSSLVGFESCPNLPCIMSRPRVSGLGYRKYVSEEVLDPANPLNLTIMIIDLGRQKGEDSQNNHAFHLPTCPQVRVLSLSSICTMLLTRE